MLSAQTVRIAQQIILVIIPVPVIYIVNVMVASHIVMLDAAKRVKERVVDHAIVLAHRDKLYQNRY